MFILLELGPLVIVLGALLYNIRKTRNLRSSLRNTEQRLVARQAQLFRQIEALHGLLIELGLRRSLPTTRGWAASPDFLLRLVVHSRQAAPRVTVECGSGVSTVVLARCSQLNGAGHVYSLEHDPEFARRTREELRRHDLAEYGTVLDSPLRGYVLDGVERRWYALDALPQLPIDLLVIDGPPGPLGPLARYPAGALLFDRLTPDAVVFLDDANRTDEMSILEKWKSEFPDFQQDRIDTEKGCARLWRSSTAVR